METRTEVAIVGAGFGGLGMAIRLLQAGRPDFVILEKADEVGGTWRDNTYPGCACDVQSHLYSYSFEGKPDWTRRFAPSGEIQAYILSCRAKFGLDRHIRYGQEVVAARFDAERSEWRLETRAGDVFIARHWILGAGPLHVPFIPELPGLDRFEGKVFHSARWDHGYPLDGKDVVSIGTGGSAIQYVPAIAPRVRRLTVLQRTPAWVIPRDERRYSALTKAAFARVPALRKLHRARLYWTNEARVWPMFNPSLARTLQQLAKAFIRLQVRDPETRRKLTPGYTIGCKRVLISNDWYRTFNRANVDLVTAPLVEIKARSVVTADGVERPADCLILGTGFVVDPREVLDGLPIVGAEGTTLQEAWRELPYAYLGTVVPGFPNLFVLVGPNTGLGHNSMIFMMEAQFRYVLSCLALLDAEGGDSLQVRRDVTEAFNAELREAFQRTVWASGCQSWYLTEDGRNPTLWPYSTWRYWLRTRRARRGDFLVRRA